jgi:hypothetical protein
MRNKELMLRRLQELNGVSKRLDTLVNRGGTKAEINETFIKITELIQDIESIVNREN